MNPFSYPEFWLSLAFFIIIGMIIFSPIRNIIRHLLKSQIQLIQNQISEASAVYNEARQAYKAAQNDLKERHTDTQTPKEIKSLYQEFSDKTLSQIEIKKQDFQTRQTLYIQETKNHLRQQLLDLVEDKMEKYHPSQSTEKEVQHFLKILKENEQILSHLPQQSLDK